MKYEYNIQQFAWDKEKNTFYADAWHLYCYNTDGWLHPESFPNRKKQFYISNPSTGGFRRFRFVSELHEQIEDGDTMVHVTIWHFQSEDGINCMITVSILDIFNI